MIEVRRDVCVAAGLCVLTVPGVFDQDDDGVVLVRGNPAEHAEAVAVAVDECPSGALRLAPDGT
ncbi:ferredoxin [Saccharomonospora xinjiangensis]|uniref:ferredoxin n=1 Tax=Saccharomonospora xinjiangensis TaxID=75294 RepID=UPI003510A95F